MFQTIRRPAALLALCAAFLGGCATSQTVPSEDSWEGLNRGIFAFNNGVDKIFLKPVARGYRFITPDPVERGVSNVFSNLSYPVVIVSNALQGKGKAALSDTGRFLVNSTIGVAGIFDVATPMGMPANNEDLGQTLAVWGVPSGPYIMIPFLGPSTLRDGVMIFGNQSLHGRNLIDNSSVRDKLALLEIVSGRASLLPLDSQLQESQDPYIFLREAYLQRRNFLIYDGDPPVDDFELEDDFDEDLDDFDDDL
ncbi:MAG: VacJ family lipoprotein [Pseudomonadota bacterium]